MKIDSKAWLLLVLLSVLWGGSFVAAKIAVAEIPPVSLMALRVSLAAVALLAILAAMGKTVPRALWLPLGVMGLGHNVVPFTLIFWGQQSIGVAPAAIINATTPLWTFVLAHFLTTDEKLTGTRLAGVLVGVAGVGVLMGPEALAGLTQVGLAQLAVLAATFSYAVAGIWGRRFRGLEPLVPAAGQLTASSVIAIPMALLVESPSTIAAPSIDAWIAVAVVALFGTAAAFVVYFALLARAGAGNALLVTMLIPPTAMFLGWIVLGETPGLLSLAGFAIILAGLVLVDGRLVHRRQVR